MGGPMGGPVGWSQGVAPDYISAFAATGGIGCHEQRQKFEAKGEIDKAILLEALHAMAALNPLGFKHGRVFHRFS